jgi:hypothetical protein
MLAVTKDYEDKSIAIPAYELIQRVVRYKRNESAEKNTNALKLVTDILKFLSYCRQGSNVVDENGEEAVDEEYMAALAELRISTFDD